MSGSSNDISALITASAVLLGDNESRPPIILVHGAANCASVWQYWQGELAASGWETHAINLRGHGNSGPIDLSCASMNDYANDVRRLASQHKQPPVIVGWSMGGLVGMMVASSVGAAACVTLAPSMPARRINAAVELRKGEFGAEEYGITSRSPEEQSGMPDLDHEERTVALASLGRESRLARDERRRGIVVKTLDCPLLVVTGTIDSAWPRQRYDALWLQADHLSAEGATHWGLVLNRRALAQTIPAVLQWVSTAIAGTPRRETSALDFR